MTFTLPSRTQRRRIISNVGPKTSSPVAVALSYSALEEALGQLVKAPQIKRKPAMLTARKCLR